MFKSINVEAEGQELILSNTHGDKVIIPRDKRVWVQKKLEQGCHECIDKLVATLPTTKDYAQDGSVYPKVNITKLDPTEEQSYNTWKSTLPTRLQSEVDYDLKGFWKENKDWSPNNPDAHMTDKFKLPNHPTFSSESQYYNPKTKKYGGNWIDTDFGTVYKANDLGVKKDKVEFKPNTDTKNKVVLGTKDGYKLLTTDSPEYKDAYSKGVGYFDDKGVFVTNKSELPEFTVTAKKPDWINEVEKQNEFIKQNYKEEHPYSIVDKKHNTIFIYDTNNNLIKQEQIITGTSNKDTDYSISMRDWLDMPENKGKSHEDYFDFLEKVGTKTTPAGHFTINSLRDNVLDNPDVFGDFWNSLFNEERKQSIYNSRKRDYGSQGKMFTLTDDKGIASSKAIHGTDNKNREAVLNEQSLAEQRDMSNGCINLNDKTICFDTLKKGSSVYILPEENSGIVTKNFSPIKEGNIIKKSKSKIYSTLRESGKEINEDILNLITAIHGKESSFGTGKRLVTDLIPGTDSHGDFQINPDRFGKYLPENYTPEFKNQVLAVYNFIEKNKNLSPVQLYRKYNSNNINKKLDGYKEKIFQDLYNKIKKVK